MAASSSWFYARYASLAMGSFITIHNMLLSFGMVQTADTGQLSMASAPTYSSAANFNYGYTVYRFNDTAQSTLPIFFRIDWKNVNLASPSTFAHTVTIGSGSDGAGTITGVTQAVIGWQYGITSTSNTQTYHALYGAGDGSGFWISYAPDYIDTTNFQYFAPCGFLMIERGRSAAGVACSTSYVWAYNVGTQYVQRVYAPAMSASAVSGGFGCFIGWPWGLITETQPGSVLPAYPYSYMDPAPQVLKMILAVNAGDYGQFSTFSATHLGTAHTWLAHTITSTQSGGYLSTPNQIFAQGSNTHCLALCFD